MYLHSVCPSSVSTLIPVAFSYLVTSFSAVFCRQAGITSSKSQGRRNKYLFWCLLVHGGRCNTGIACRHACIRWLQDDGMASRKDGNLLNFYPAGNEQIVRHGEEVCQSTNSSMNAPRLWQAQQESDKARSLAQRRREANRAWDDAYVTVESRTSVTIPSSCLLGYEPSSVLSAVTSFEMGFSCLSLCAGRNQVERGGLERSCWLRNLHWTALEGMCASYLASI